MFTIALKSTLARSWRLATTGLAIVISVAFICGTLLITNLIDATLGTLISGQYQGIDAVVRSTDVQKARFGTDDRRSIPTGTLDAIRDTPGIAAAEGVVTGFITLIDRNGERIQQTFSPPSVVFNSLADAALSPGPVASGRAPASPDEAVLDSRTAREFGFEIGMPITAQLPAGLRTFTIVGIGGLGETGTDSSGFRVLTLTTPVAQELTNNVGQFNYLAVRATDGVGQSELAAALGARLQPGSEAITGEAFTAENEESITRVIALFSKPILAFGYISVFVGTFVIYNTFSILVGQRTRELALLRAVGASRRQILGSVLIEATVVGVVSSATGLAIGYALATGLKSALGRFLTLPGGPLALTTSTVVVALATGVVTTVIAASVPGIRASRIAPVAAMSEVGRDQSHLSRARRWAGPAMIAVALALVLGGLTELLSPELVWIGIGAAMLFTSVAVIGPVFAGPLTTLVGTPLTFRRGVAGRLARTNAARNPKRTAVTAAALSIGVGLVVIVAVFAASIRSGTQSTLGTSLGAGVDLVVDSGTSPGGLSSEARRVLEGSSLVQRYTPLRFTGGIILDGKTAREKQAEPDADLPPGVPAGNSEFFVGVDTAQAFQMIKLIGLDPPVAKLERNEVLMVQSVLDDEGWKVGDEIEMWFPEKGVTKLRIAASFTTRLAGAEMLADVATIDAVALPQYRVDQQLWVQLRDGVTAEEALASLKPLLKANAPAAGINTFDEFLGERIGIVDSVVQTIYVLLALSIIIALVGVANTISLSLLERRREIGLLRAVGAMRAQLRSSVRWESAIISLGGTLIGTAIGTALACAFVVALDQQGFDPVVPVRSVAIIAVLGVVCGVITAAVPAWRAARTDVLSAIDSL